MAQGEIQDDVPGAPDRPNADRGLLVGLIVIGGLLMALIAVVVFLRWPDATDEGWGNVDGTGEPLALEAVGDPGVAIFLEEGFAIDDSGALSADAQKMIEDLEGQGGVVEVVYVGPAIVAGFAPDAPTLETTDHELWIYGVGDSFETTKHQVANAYARRAGVALVEVLE